MRKRIVRKRSNVNAPAGDDFAEYIAAVHRAAHAFGLYFDSALGGSVTQPEAVALLHLARHGESTINDVHAAFLHKRSTLTSVVDRLERKRLVRRRVGESDRRNFMLVLTAEGTRAANRIVEAVMRLRESLGAELVHMDVATSLLDASAAACRSGDAGAGTVSRS